SGKCQFGGDAKLAFAVSVDPSLVGAKYNIAYNNCGAVKGAAGVANLNGSFDITQSVATTAGSASISQAFKGKVTFGGAYDDFLDADITQSVDVSSTDCV